jgi:hypothetical protein
LLFPKITLQGDISTGATTDMDTFQNIDELLSQLNLSEKVELLAGIGACSTASNDRLGIPNLEVC